MTAACRYNYVRSVTPPAPFVYLELLRPGEPGPPTEWPAQLDTAADQTVFPPEVVRVLGLVQTGDTWVAGLGGTPIQVPTYFVRLAIRGLQPMTVKVVAFDEEPHILLGRDVLNAHRIVLDGPRLVCDVE